MLKKLLKRFKKRTYVTKEQKKVFDSDLLQELEKKVQKIREQKAIIKEKNRKVNAFLEILEDGGRGYSDEELAYLYHKIINSKEKV